MELSKRETSELKGIAALLLVFLHLFNTRDYSKIQSILIIGNVPIEYYISLVSEECVAMYLFCSGYGLATIDKNIDIKDNIIRILKLLINYWIVLIGFVIVGYLLENENYPGSSKEFLMNFLLLSKSYNGAWWFLQTYVILVLLSKSIINIVKKNNTIVIFFISGLIYFFGVLQSVKGIINIGDNELLNIMLNTIINFAICQFSFIVGIIFIKENTISNIRKKLEEKKYTQILSYILILFTFSINVIIENWIIGPITAILIIITYSIIKLDNRVELFLSYISTHSTNIWLTHMFFYMIFFSDLVYAPKYSILIFIWLMVLCIATSYIINTIYKPIIKIIDKIKEEKVKLVQV